MNYIKQTKTERGCPFLKQLPANLPVVIHRSLQSDLSSIDSNFLQSVPMLRDRQHAAKHVEALQSTKVEEPWQFAAAYQLRAFISKYQWPGDSVATRDAAIRQFKADDSTCAATNKLLRSADFPSFDLIRQEIRNLLPVVDMDELYTHTRHGPGVSNRKSKLNSAYSKYVDWPYTVTLGCRDIAIAAIRANARWFGALEDSYRKNLARRWSLEKQEKTCGVNTSISAYTIPLPDSFWSEVLHVVPGNRLTTVPKNDRTDRSIAIEPVMNCYIQLGVDGVIKRRLLRWGIDLSDQGKNCYKAWEGSSNNSYCTVDLSSASDLVSLRICKKLLPPDWFKLLMSIRSPEGLLPDGSTVKYRKISSMGNGTTFALESLIFAAIARVSAKVTLCDPHDITVYGDDIIVPPTCRLVLVKLLRLCGFRLNREKSFFTGPFRESCGTDWYNGHYCRPVFCKKLASLADFITLHNRLRYWAYVVLGSSGPIENTLALLRSYVQIKQPPIGPENMLNFTAYFHMDTWEDNALALHLKKESKPPNDWLFGRLLASHKGYGSMGLRRPNSLEDIAYKLYLKEGNLPDNPSVGSVYSVTERTSAQRWKLRDRPLDEAVKSYQDPIALLKALYGS